MFQISASKQFLRNVTMFSIDTLLDFLTIHCRPGPVRRRVDKGVDVKRLRPKTSLNGNGSTQGTIG